MVKKISQQLISTINQGLGNKLFWAMIILTITLVLRWGYVITQPQTLSFDEPIYNDIVTNLLSGKGYVFSSNAYYTALPYQPTSYQEPLYPLFLAGIYRIVGIGEFRMARMIQAVLNTFSVALLMGIAFKIWRKNAIAGVFVGLLGASSIPLIYFTGLLMTENLFIFFLLFFVYLWLNATQSDKYRSVLFFGAGITFAAACLTRGMLLWFLPLLLLITFILTFRHSPTSMIWLMIGIMVTISPWTLRNLIVQGAFIPITTKGGFALYAYTYPAESLDFNNRWDQIPIPNLEGLTEVQRETRFRELAIENIKSYPLLQVRFAFHKLLDFWNPMAERGPWFARILYVLTFVGMTIFALMGMIWMLKTDTQRPLGLLLMSLILFHSLAAMIFTGGGKARLTIEPLLMILASNGLTVFLQKLKVISC